MYKTYADLHDLAAEFAFEYASLDRNEFLAHMDTHGVYIETRSPIRYAATRAIWATPTFFSTTQMMCSLASIRVFKTG